MRFILCRICTQNYRHFTDSKLIDIFLEIFVSWRRTYVVNKIAVSNMYRHITYANIWIETLNFTFLVNEVWYCFPGWHLYYKIPHIILNPLTFTVFCKVSFSRISSKSSNLYSLLDIKNIIDIYKNWWHKKWLSLYVIIIVFLFFSVPLYF